MINRLVRGRAIDRRIPVASTPSSRIAPSRKLANGKGQPLPEHGHQEWLRTVRAARTAASLTTTFPAGYQLKDLVLDSASAVCASAVSSTFCGSGLFAFSDFGFGLFGLRHVRRDRRRLSHLGIVR